MQAPELWLNGRQLTGYASDRAPVLAGVEISWGTDSPDEQPDPASMSFSVLFRDGMHDVPDLTNGGAVELVQDATATTERVTVFAGTIRSMRAEPDFELGEQALRVNATCMDYMADLEETFTSAFLMKMNPTSMAGKFAQKGWSIIIPDREAGYPEEEMTYDSIKLLTLLDRYMYPFKGQRCDASYRNSSGNLVKRVKVVSRATYANKDSLAAYNPVGPWVRSIKSANSYYSYEPGNPFAPLLIIPAENMLANPTWAQDSEDVITAVHLKHYYRGVDENGNVSTGTKEYDYTRPDAITQYGTRKIEIESDVQDLTEGKTKLASEASKWFYTTGAKWKMSALDVYDTDAMEPVNLVTMLDQTKRTSTFVVVNGILRNRPDPGLTTFRAYVDNGKYVWNGEKWEMTLGFARPINEAADSTSLDYSWSMIGTSAIPGIRDATYETVGELTYADFTTIRRP